MGLYRKEVKEERREVRCTHTFRFWFIIGKRDGATGQGRGGGMEWYTLQGRDDGMRRYIGPGGMERWDGRLH